VGKRGVSRLAAPVTVLHQRRLAGSPQPLQPARHRHGGRAPSPRQHGHSRRPPGSTSLRPGPWVRAARPPGPAPGPITPPAPSLAWGAFPSSGLGSRGTPRLLPRWGVGPWPSCCPSSGWAAAGPGLGPRSEVSGVVRCPRGKPAGWAGAVGALAAGGGWRGRLGPWRACLGSDEVKHYRGTCSSKSRGGLGRLEAGEVLGWMFSVSNRKYYCHQRSFLVKTS